MPSYVKYIVIGFGIVQADFEVITFGKCGSILKVARRFYGRAYGKPIRSRFQEDSARMIFYTNPVIGIVCYFQVGRIKPIAPVTVFLKLILYISVL